MMAAITTRASGFAIEQANGPLWVPDIPTR